MKFVPLALYVFVLMAIIGLGFEILNNAETSQSDISIFQAPPAISGPMPIDRLSLGTLVTR